MNTPASRSLLAAALVLAASLAYGADTVPSRPDVSPAKPVIPGHTFKLADFGAKGDGTTLNTDAFKKAIAAVGKAGGGTLEVPGGTYLTGAIDLCSGLNLHLAANATIKFSPNFDEYRNGARFRPLIGGAKLNDVEISGEGIINGSGEAWWPSAIAFKTDADSRHITNNTSPRPTMLNLTGCQRVLLQGVTFTSAPVFNIVLSNCEDVTADHVKIFNPNDLSPNTDGIDPAGSRRVLITHCNIDTDDDCIAIKSSNAKTPVEDILVTDCTFGHRYGCAIGSETNGSVRHVTFRNCTFDGNRIAIYLKASRDRGGVVDDVVYENITMKNVGEIIHIASYYPDNKIPAPGVKVEPAPLGDHTPQWSNITIRNIVATGGTRDAGVIMGLPEAPAANITLSNVTIEAPTGLRLGYASKITLDKVSINAAKGPPLITDDTVKGLVQGSSPAGSKSAQAHY